MRLKSLNGLNSTKQTELKLPKLSLGKIHELNTPPTESK